MVSSNLVRSQHAFSIQLNNSGQADNNVETMGKLRYDTRVTECSDIDTSSSSRDKVLGGTTHGFDRGLLRKMKPSDLDAICCWSSLISTVRILLL